MSLHPRFDVSCTVSKWHNFYHCAAVLSGLCELASEGRINLNLVPSDDRNNEDGETRGGGFVRVDVRADGCLKRLTLDLHDASNVFGMNELHECDVYFKRSFFKDDIAKLPSELRQKLRPFGITYGTRTHRGALTLLAKFAPRLAWAAIRHPRATLRVLSLKKTDLKTFLLLPTFRSYEWPPNALVEEVVVFQPRIWELDDLGPDTASEVNDPRITLVRELRREFGSRFRGGLVPTPMACRLYPDLLSTAPTRRSAYIDFSKRCLVAVSTRGLHHSMPFKVAEALASSKVLVTTRLRNELPNPLEAGHHLLEFSEGNVESCVAACASALESPSRARALRLAAWDYYKREVEPATHVMNLLERSFS